MCVWSACHQVLLNLMGTESPLSLGMDKQLNGWLPCGCAACAPTGLRSALGNVLSKRQVSGRAFRRPLTSSRLLFHVQQLSGVEISTEGQTSSRCSSQAASHREGSWPRVGRAQSPRSCVTLGKSRWCSGLQVPHLRWRGTEIAPAGGYGFLPV